MPAIRFAPFTAMLPRTATRLLPQTAAVTANNLILTSGEIGTLRAPAAVVATLVTNAISVYRASYNGSDQWLSWAVDVDVARAPLSYDVEPRFYWTGDGEPRFATFSDLPSTYFALGIPAPIQTPTGSVTGGVAANVDRYYRTTFYSQDNEESSPSPVSAIITGPSDGSWDLTPPTKYPLSSGSCTVVYSSPTTTVTTTGTPAEHWLRAGDEITLDGVAATVATVTSTTVFTVTGDYTGATAWARKAPWNTTGIKQRLYRTTGTTGTWQLVDDDIGFTGSYSDTLSDADILGDELISDGWLTPPTGLRGIITLPNGSLCAFSGHLLCFSEPYQPHAWPLAYQYGVDYPIVGIAAFGTSVVAGTEANPYIADGIDPNSMSLNKAGPVWPCLSKRSVCSLGDAVIYASAVGLITVGSGGADVWSKNFYTEREWSDLGPDTMECEVSNSYLFVLYTGSDSIQAMLSFNLMEAALTTLNPTDLTINGLYSDLRNGELYFILSDGDLYQHDSSEGAALNFTWESKDFISPYDTTLTAGRISYESELTAADIAAVAAANAAVIVANTASIGSWTGAGAMNGSAYNTYALNDSSLLRLSSADNQAITVTLYVDGTLRFSSVVPSNATFRMPSGYKGKKVRVRLTGSVRVHWLELAGSPVELAKQ